MSFERDLLDAKLALEAELSKPLYIWGVRYIEACGENGGHIGAHDKMQAVASLEAILARHYARVTMIMQGRRPPRNPTLAGAVRFRTHFDSLATQVKANAHMIVASIDREMARAMTATDAFDAGDWVDDGTGAKSVASYHETKDDKPGLIRWWGPGAGYVMRMTGVIGRVLEKWKAKLKTVVIANTNGVAEQARDAEVERKVPHSDPGNATPPPDEPIEIVPDDQANGHIVKTWNSLLDGRERPAHHDAHGQEVTVASAFTVGGASLRFPGDSSLGAPLSQTANCRCYLTHYFLHDDGRRTPLHTGPSAPTRRFRRPGDTLPPNILPTSVVTLNGRTRARVFLADKKPAVMEQTSPSTIVVRRDGRTLARADIRNGKPEITVEPGTQGLDIDGLIRRSVEASRTMDRRPHNQRP